MSSLQRLPSGRAAACWAGAGCSCRPAVPALLECWTLGEAESRRRQRRRGQTVSSLHCPVIQSPPASAAVGARSRTADQPAASPPRGQRRPPDRSLETGEPAARAEVSCCRLAAVGSSGQEGDLVPLPYCREPRVTAVGARRLGPYCHTLSLWS
ncbi:hypothetical protein ZEAMMB73_Zm00001d042158 [Zea mays]|uniref:Uncharacterized protein n=1 Tax=Zea mays TaxID=4577 RepID=A0A1D6N1V5_MAIZE|nr:hypothetical protein ZEAMMB73_Zm00001d042158 [Zea mays]